MIRAIVQTLLLEVANRQARERSAEIPLWLAEGLTQHLLAAAEADLVLEPQARRNDQLRTNAQHCFFMEAMGDEQ